VDLASNPALNALKTKTSPRLSQASIQAKNSPDVPSPDSSSWGHTPTLTDSVVDSNTAVEQQSPTRRISRLDETKLQRRRTVIIETSNSCNVRQQARVTLDLSHLRDNYGPVSPDDEDSVPLESASPHLSFSPRRFSHSTPSRPPSSATMRPPAKGILKEKKSVRFSMLPSMHEYSTEDEQRQDAPTVAEQPLACGVTTGLRNSAPRQGLRHGSPLRQSFSADTRPDIGTSSTYRASFPKHPTVRSTVASPTTTKHRGPTVYSSPISIGGKRLPLHSKVVNGQTQPTTRITDPYSPGPKVQSRVQVISTPKKLKPKVTKPDSSPARAPTPSVRPKSLPSKPSGDENKARKSTTGFNRNGPTSPPKTRMPVPFRSLITKLRT